MLRIFNGIAIAGSFTAIESWLNAKLNNQNRVRYFSFYRTIDMVGGLVAQIMIIVLLPAHFVSYTVIAVLICLSLLPLGLTQSVQPQMPKQEKFRPLFVRRFLIDEQREKNAKRNAKTQKAKTPKLKSNTSEEQEATNKKTTGEQYTSQSKKEIGHSAKQSATKEKAKSKGENSKNNNTRNTNVTNTPKNNT